MLPTNAPWFLFPLVLSVCVAAAPQAGAGRQDRAASRAAAAPVFALAPGSPIRVGPMAGEPAVADMDRNGTADIVVACGTCCGSRPDPRSGHLVVLLGDGRGGFRPAKGSPVAIGSSARKVAVGDLNGDGSLDVVVGQHDSYEVAVLLGDGAGGLAPSPASPVIAGKGQRPHTHDVALADMDGDGRLDLLATNANDGNVGVLAGDGKGGFEHAPGSPVACGRHPYDVVTAQDLDGDGKLDLVAPDLLMNRITVLLNRGKGTWEPAPGSPLQAGRRPGYLVLADVNGDRRGDLLVAHDDEFLLGVLLGDGKGGFRPAPDGPAMLRSPVWGIAAADFDGDGDVDVALGEANERGLVILVGDGHGGFAPTASSISKGGGGYVAAADVNGDKRPDLIASSYSAGILSVWLNEGTRVTDAVATEASAPRLDLDVAVTKLSSGWVMDTQWTDTWGWAMAAWRVDDIVARFEARAKESAGSADAHVDLGNAYTGKVSTVPGARKAEWGQKADEAYDKALAIDASHPRAHYCKATALSVWPPTSNKQPEAAKHFEAFVKGQESAREPRPELAEAYFQLGRMLNQQGKKEEAMEVWKKAYQRFPEHEGIKSKVQGGD